MNFSRLHAPLISMLLIAAMSLSLNAASPQTTDDLVLGKAAHDAFVKGDYAVAEAYYRESILRAEGSNISPSRQATMWGNLAHVLMAQGRYKEAEELFNRSLKF